MKIKNEKLLDKIIFITFISQLVFILCMNIFRADTIIDFDSSSAYLHEIEMGSQGKIFPLEYSYQASMDLDSASLLSAFLYHFTGNIFLSRGITNNLIVLLYIYVVWTILSNFSISVVWKRFCLLLFLIPYSMIMLGYWRMLFTGGSFYAFRALVPLLIISLILDIEKSIVFRKYAGRLALLLFIIFLTGLSSGAYVLMSAVFPLILWEGISAFLQGDYRNIKSKRMMIALAAIFAACVGMVVQKAVGFSSTADKKYILTSSKWVDAVLSAFAGLFELFGGLTIHEHVKLFSVEAIGTAVDFVVTCILIFAIIYTAVKCIKKKELSNWHGYVFSLMLVNAFMFSFLDLKYGGTVFESRYHLIPMLPAFFLLAIMMEDCSGKKLLNKVQSETIQYFVIGIFIASMLYGDAQWVYAKTANECDKLVELNSTMENEGVNTAVVVGEDSKGLGRKLRVYSRKVNYLVVDDGAKSSFRTTFGGTTRYLDNNAQQGKTVIIATPATYETLPPYLTSGMKHFMDYDNLQIYIADGSRFDYACGPVAGKDKVIDFPYTPGYNYENAMLNDNGQLVMKDGGGSLNASYAAVPGDWIYSLYYDFSEAGDSDDAAYMEIQAGNGELIRVELNRDSGVAVAKGILMSQGENVSFKVSAPAGVKIQYLEISRKE